MKPIVRVIAHTTFLGVPPDLLPIDKAKNQQEVRFKEAQRDAYKAPAPGDTVPKVIPLIPRDLYFSDRVIEAEARRLVNAAGQDQGTDAEKLKAAEAEIEKLRAEVSGYQAVKE